MLCSTVVVQFCNLKKSLFETEIYDADMYLTDLEQQTTLLKKFIEKGSKLIANDEATHPSTNS